MTPDKTGTTLRDILALLQTLAPESDALPNDPVGLLIGSADNRPVRKVGICLDATPDTCALATDQDMQLVIAHHPLLYQPLKRLDPAADPIARAALCLAGSDVALYAMHTNWDKAPGGINDTLAECLELANVHPLGDNGELSLPRIGDLPTPRPFSDFARYVEQTLTCVGANALRAVPPGSRHMVSRVAVCGGAGAGMLQQAHDAGADAYVTSDVRHHEFLHAAGIGLALLDAGHEATENPGMRSLMQILAKRLPDVEVVWAGT